MHLTLPNVIHINEARPATLENYPTLSITILLSIFSRIRKFGKSLFFVRKGLSFVFRPEISYMRLNISHFLSSILQI